MIGHHFAEFLFGSGKMGGDFAFFKESIGNALGGLAKVGHVLTGDLQSSQSPWIIWRRRESVCRRQR